MSGFVDTCPECGGDGGWESRPHGYNHNDGSPLTYWIDCRACDGSGEIEQEDAPLDMEDALMMDAEILRSQGVDVADPVFLEEPVEAVRQMLVKSVDALAKGQS